MSTFRPAFFTAAAVTGPMAAIVTCGGRRKSRPMMSMKWKTVEGLVIADIDLGMISLAKAAADPAGHYARPDVTRLLLNKTPGDRVVTQLPAGTQLNGVAHVVGPGTKEASTEDAE